VINRDGLLALVEAWLPKQRWFAGKGRAATIDIAPLADLPGTSPTVTIWLVHARYDDGTVETYPLPLVAYRDRMDGLDHVLLGALADTSLSSDLQSGGPDDPIAGQSAGDGPLWVYDALHDKAVTPAWLAAIRDRTVSGPLSFQLHVEPSDIPVDEPSLVVTAEQSNTSLVYGDTALLKVFRRLQPGVNPDIEVHAALLGAGGRHLAGLLGSVEATIDGTPHSLAMLQEFLTSATDGWELAKASVRDLMAEADLHAEEAGGDFAAEAHRLGVAVAEVHADLATAFGTVAIDANTMRVRADQMRARLEYALTVVPELKEVAPGVAKTFDALADVSGLGDGAELQRIHGDLHLSQVLRTVHRWVVIDFEGEPMADVQARRQPDFAMRDVAGMLRSFAYVAFQRVVESGYDQQLSYRANEWAQRNRGAFCDGYAEASGHDPRETPIPLRAFEADKAIYEAVYEARNRPAWLPIPLASLTRLAEGTV
jgi:maltokinase